MTTVYRREAEALRREYTKEPTPLLLSLYASAQREFARSLERSYQRARQRVFSARDDVRYARGTEHAYRALEAHQEAIDARNALKAEAREAKHVADYLAADVKRAFRTPRTKETEPRRIDPKRRPGQPNKAAERLRARGYGWTIDAPCGADTRSPIVPSEGNQTT